MKSSSLFKNTLSLLSLFLLFSFNLHASPLAEKNVFELSATISDPNTVLLTWKIKPGNFLYKKRFSFKLAKEQALGPVRYPDTFVTKKYTNNAFDVYRDQLILPLAILNEKAGSYDLVITHQGCADSGFCYPPTQTAFIIKVNQLLELVSITPKSAQKKHTLKGRITKQPALSPYQTLFENHNIFFIILSFYGFGLLLAFTPCVLPMIPVLSGIIVGQHKQINSRKALFLSISYVLGMSLTYAIVGVIIAALGQNLQTLFQSPITIGLFAFLFVILSLSMFDFYSLSLPQSWQAKLSKRSNKQNNGAYIGAASMGALSTLILSPCVTAPLVGALSYIAKTSNLLLGGFSLFFLGLGMGTPLVIIGASAGKLLPKAGNWMNHIKHAFGIILLIIAISLLERIAPPALTMLSWSALLIICSLFISQANKEFNTNKAILAVGVSILLFIYGVLILIGVSLGNTSPYQPLKSIQQESNLPINNKPNMITVDNLNSASEIIKQAKVEHKKVLIDFYADWCSSCKEMDKVVFNDPKVQYAMKETVFLKINVTKRNNNSQILEKKFNVIAPPTLILLNDNGHESTRMIGETDKQEVIKALEN